MLVSMSIRPQVLNIGPHLAIPSFIQCQKKYEVVQTTRIESLHRI